MFSIAREILKNRILKKKKNLNLKQNLKDKNIYIYLYIYERRALFYRRIEMYKQKVFMLYTVYTHTYVYIQRVK